MIAVNVMNDGGGDEKDRGDADEGEDSQKEELTPRNTMN